MDSTTIPTDAPRHDLSRLVVPDSPHATLGNVADVLSVLQAVDLQEQPSDFGMYLLLQSAEGALRHALCAPAELKRGAATDGVVVTIGIELHTDVVAYLHACAAPHETPETFASRLIAEAFYRQDGA